MIHNNASLMDHVSSDTDTVSTSLTTSITHPPSQSSANNPMSLVVSDNDEQQQHQTRHMCLPFRSQIRRIDLDVECAQKITSLLPSLPFVPIRRVPVYTIWCNRNNRKQRLVTIDNDRFDRYVRIAHFFAPIFGNIRFLYKLHQKTPMRHASIWSPTLFHLITDDNKKDDERSLFIYSIHVGKWHRDMISFTWHDGKQWYKTRTSIMQVVYNAHRDKNSSGQKDNPHHKVPPSTALLHMDSTTSCSPPPSANKSGGIDYPHVTWSCLGYVNMNNEFVSMDRFMDAEALEQWMDKVDHLKYESWMIPRSDFLIPGVPLRTESSLQSQPLLVNKTISSANVPPKNHPQMMPHCDDTSVIPPDTLIGSTQQKDSTLAEIIIRDYPVFVPCVREQHIPPFPNPNINRKAPVQTNKTQRKPKCKPANKSTKAGVPIHKKENHQKDNLLWIDMSSQQYIPVRHMMCVSRMGTMGQCTQGVSIFPRTAVFAPCIESSFPNHVPIKMSNTVTVVNHGSTIPKASSISTTNMRHHGSSSSGGGDSMIRTPPSPTRPSDRSPCLTAQNHSEEFHTIPALLIQSCANHYHATLVDHQDAFLHNRQSTRQIEPISTRDTDASGGTYLQRSSAAMTPENCATTMMTVSDYCYNRAIPSLPPFIDTTPTNVGSEEEENMMAEIVEAEPAPDLPFPIMQHHHHTSYTNTQTQQQQQYPSATCPVSTPYSMQFYTRPPSPPFVIIAADDDDAPPRKRARLVA